MADEGAALAAELARRTEAEAVMAAALVELERHPGHLTLSSGATTGVTAQRWATASAALAGLWQDFATYRGVLDAARARPAERRLLLREPSIEVSRTPVALAQRGLTGAAETVETITLDALATRMDAAFREVGDVVTTCDAVQRAVFGALVPTADQARAALATARGLDPDGVDPDVGPLTAAVAEIEETCVHDPLALADRPTSDVLAPLQDALDAVARRCGELVAVRDGWAGELDALAAALTAAEALRDEGQRAQRVARELIVGADPVVADPVPHLRERLAALPTVAGWPARAAALADLRAAIATATARLRTAADEAAGLVERRSELRGRFEAYRAKASRLGVAERPDLLAAGDRVRDLLWTRPCDLAGATLALVDYQRLIRDGG
jgi:hypothetical protein